MEGLLAVPISGVASDWLHTSFIPGLQKAVDGLPDGGILWVHVDAGPEADYLLTVACTWAKSYRRDVVELTVFEDDPFLAWEDLFGTPDQAPAYWSQPAGSIVCVQNGTVLPITFLRDRLSLIATYCKASKYILIIPILHDAIRYVRDASGSTTHLEVPKFASISEPKRRILTDTMVQADIPSLAEELRVSLVEQLLGTDPPPASRTELQSWIDFYRDQTDVASALRMTPPPPLARQPKLPLETPGVDGLRSRMKVLVENLRKSSDAFMGWFGRPLFGPVYEPPDPFQSSDPVYWFSASVSYLSSWLECADRAFESLVRYEFNNSTADLEATSPHSFYEVLRRLRTAQQHGLNPSSAPDRETLDIVGGWYYRHCGMQKPLRRHWRKLTSCLLEDAENAANRLAICVAKVPGCASRDVVASQLRFHSRSLSKDGWRSQLRQSIQILAPHLDVERVLDKYLAELQKGLRDSTVVTDEVLIRARELADIAVRREGAKCPVSAKDLIDMGIEPGSKLRIAIAQIEAEWRRDPDQSPITLLEFTRGIISKS
jgi:hypothetical protein